MKRKKERGGGGEGGREAKRGREKEREIFWGGGSAKGSEQEWVDGVRVVQVLHGLAASGIESQGYLENQLPAEDADMQRSAPGFL